MSLYKSMAGINLVSTGLFLSTGNNTAAAAFAVATLACAARAYLFEPGHEKTPASDETHEFDPEIFS